MKLAYIGVPGSLLLLSLLSAPASAAPAADVPSQCAPAGGPSVDLLSLDVESLLNMKVVTASKFAEPVADAPGVITVVSQDELQRFGGITLAEILGRVPGMQATTAYFTDRSIIAARGDQTKINGGHILFLINGRPSREVLEGGLVSDLLESFPVNVLERIEIVKGPGSVLYGSNAFSAVVNLITKKAGRNSFSVTALPGAGGARAASGQGTFSCGSFSLVGAAQVHQRPDWNTSYRFTDPIPNDPLAVGAPPVQNVTIRDHSVGGYVGLNYKDLSFMSSFTQWQTSSFVRGSVGEDEWKRGFADLGYSAHPTKTWTSNVDLTYTRNTFASPGYPFIQRDSHEALLEWTNFFTPTTRDRITVGALYDYTQGHEMYYGVTPAVPISDGSRSATAAYAQVDHRFTNSLTGIGGVQLNKIPSLALDAVPRVGLIWNPAARINVKALYGEAYRAPSINETLLNHPGLAGNPNLKPEDVETLDLEVSYTGERVQGSVNYFHSRQYDSIVVDTTPARWRYVNLGEATFQGIEFEGKYYLTKDLFALGSMLHQMNMDNTGATDITPVPATSLKAGLSYQIARRVTASVFDTFSGAIAGYTNTLNPGPRAYQLIDAEFRLELAPYFHHSGDKSLAFVLHANNLANQQVWLPDWGGNTGDTIPTYQGRTIYAGVEIALAGRGAVSDRR